MFAEQDNFRWVPCPTCEKKTRTKVYKDTVLIKFPLYCHECRKETLVDVIQFKMVLSERPEK